MIVGFTGTRHGMTERQASKFKEIICSMNTYEFHHGDCVGSDAEAHNIVRGISDIIIHPPIDPKYRAFCKGAFLVHPEREYKKRNCDIIDDSELIIVTPHKEYEELRSGTWHAIRYAKKIGKHIIIIWPNGNTQEINNLTE
jgi:hypothetical protein